MNVFFHKLDTQNYQNAQIATVHVRIGNMIFVVLASYFTFSKLVCKVIDKMIRSEIVSKKTVPAKSL